MAAGGAPTAAVAATGGAETTCTVHDVIVALLTHCAPSSADAPPVDSAENKLEATATPHHGRMACPTWTSQLDRTVPIDFGAEEFAVLSRSVERAPF